MMAFNKDMVAAVKANGQILRERDENTVYLPFGAEYSLLIKNLSTRKAQVDVEIDGEDVLGGRSLIIEPNSETELERYIGDSLSRGNKFKFIEKTGEISRHRGDRIDDGIVRITYRFEREKPAYDFWVTPTATKPKWIKHEWTDWDTYRPENFHAGPPPMWEADPHSPDLTMTSFSSTVHYADTDEGITVPGEISDQAFRQGHIGPLERQSHVITLRLRGRNESGRELETPVTVKKKFECSTCGNKEGSRARFCSRCGTALEII